jgi:hypothetical protein
VEDPIDQLPAAAQDLLIKNDYCWDGVSAYRWAGHPSMRSSDQYVDPEPDLIARSELEDHGMFDPDASPAKRRAALDWLEARVKKSS